MITLNNNHASYTSSTNNHRRNLPWFVTNDTRINKPYTVKSRKMSEEELQQVRDRIFEYKRTRNVLLTITMIATSGVLYSLLNFIV